MNCADLAGEEGPIQNLDHFLRRIVNNQKWLMARNEDSCSMRIDGHWMNVHFLVAEEESSENNVFNDNTASNFIINFLQGGMSPQRSATPARIYYSWQVESIIGAIIVTVICTRNNIQIDMVLDIAGGQTLTFPVYREILRKVDDPSTQTGRTHNYDYQINKTAIDYITPWFNLLPINGIHVGYQPSGHKNTMYLWEMYKELARFDAIRQGTYEDPELVKILTTIVEVHHSPNTIRY